jgi:thiol:disulfide interchange protein DsbD
VATWIFSTLGLVPELLLWGVYLIVVAIYLNATQSLPERVNGWYKLSKGIGTVLLVWGIMMLVGAAYNQSDPLHPLPKPTIVTVAPGENSTNASGGIPFELVRSLEELEGRRKQAIKEKKPMVVFFYTDWCPVCKKLKAITLIDPKVREMLRKNFIAVKVDMTDLNDRKSQAIRKKFNVYGPPSFVFFDRNGREMKEEQFYGYIEPEVMYDMLDLMAEDE